MESIRGPEGREGQPGREGAQGREGLPGITGTTGEPGSVGKKGERGNSGPLPRNVRVAFWFVVIVSALTLSVLAYFVKGNRDLGERGDDAHVALCILRANLVDRADATADFLQRHPQAIILGVPRATLEKSLRDLLQTISALQILNCRSD